MIKSTFGSEIPNMQSAGKSAVTDGCSHMYPLFSLFCDMIYFQFCFNDIEGSSSMYIFKFINFITNDTFWYR